MLDAEGWIEAEVRSQIQRAAGSNQLLSLDETGGLPSFMRIAADELRADKPPHARVYVEEVAARSTARVVHALRALQTSERDAQFLSQAEVRALERSEPDMGSLARRAYEAIRGSDESLADAALSFLGRPDARGLLYGFSDFGTRIDARPGQPARECVAPAVLEGFDHAFQAEAQDWGSAVLKRIDVEGQSMLFVHVSTDGDDGHVEVYTDEGVPLVSGRMLVESFVGPDPYFGLSRWAGGLSYSVPSEEGFSEDPERRAAGQILSSWTPVVSLGEGRIEHDRIAVVRFEPAGLEAPYAEVARTVVELMYPRSLQYRADGPGPIPLERNAEIQMGRHVDPRNAEDYIVGAYRDIDDDSYVFYFQRSPSGVLTPRRAQYDN